MFWGCSAARYAAAMPTEVAPSLRSSCGTRLQVVNRHLARSSNEATTATAATAAAAAGRSDAGQTTISEDPFPDPGDYRGKALAFTTKPSPSTAKAVPGSGGASPLAEAVGSPVLTPDDHDHFLRTGFIHLKAVIPPESVAAALETLQQPRPDCTRLHAAVRELLGVSYSLELNPTSGGYDMSRPLLSPEVEPEKYATALAGSNSATVVTHGRAHCDDAYGTLMAQGWALGSFIFLTPVESRGGAFIVYPGSYLRYREAMGHVGPGGYKGIAPEYSGDLHEVLAEPGDAVIFHHLMGHSGSENVSSQHTRHALLNRYHPSTRLAPPPHLPTAAMSTLERANSARCVFAAPRTLAPYSSRSDLTYNAVTCHMVLYGRYLRERFGIGRCLAPPTAPPRFPLPQLLQQQHPVYTMFFLYGVFQLWVVPAESPHSLLRWFSDDLTGWTAAPALQLPEHEPAAGAAALSLSAGSRIVDLQFHHYDLEAVLSLCVVDADGANDRCLLYESSAFNPSTGDGTPTAIPGGSWRAMGSIVAAGCVRPRPRPRSRPLCVPRLVTDTCAIE